MSGVKHDVTFDTDWMHSSCLEYEGGVAKAVPVQRFWQLRQIAYVQMFHEKQSRVKISILCIFMND